MKIFRYSGMPLNESDLTKYKQEWEAGFDKAKETAGQNMEVMQKSLSDLDDMLKLQFELVSEAKLPTTQKGWKTLLQEYDCPVLLALEKDNPNSLVLVVMDEPLQN